MLHTVKALRGDHILADDGDAGSVDDLYFDERRWGVSFVVVATGSWLRGRKVAIPPATLERADLERPRLEDALRVHMSREDVERSPELAASAPSGSHLRSSAELIGYALAAPDGAAGRIADFVVDAAHWAIADLIVETRGGAVGGVLGGRRVLVPPSAVESIDRAGRTVRVRLSCAEVRNAPPVD